MINERQRAEVASGVLLIAGLVMLFMHPALGALLACVGSGGLCALSILNARYRKEVLLGEAQRDVSLSRHALDAKLAELNPSMQRVV